MDLHRQLKQARARPKRPLSRTAFTVVSALVREYELDESFLAELREISQPGAAGLRSFEPRAKEPFEPPPFSLVPERQYRLAQDMVAAADNPYLVFARSPEELLLAAPLFRFNPGLEPAILARTDFRTLLAREIVLAEIAGLRQGPAAAGEPPARLASLEDLLARLNAFINSSISNNK
jgi:hypothetical protein